jgi:pilus assembly protein CpaB
MDVKKIMLLIGALVIAAITAVTAKNMFTGASAPTAQAKPVVPAGPEILVATRALPIGTIIDAEALRFQMWPEGLVQPTYFKKDDPATGDPASLIGAVVRNEISAGQPLVLGSLIKPGDRGFMAAALSPGMRAITVGVSTTGSVSGFIFPGDRVDMMLTQEVGGGDGPPLKVVETIFKNVRILATDHRVSALNDDGKAADVKNIDNVTLEVTPKIAEKIQVAQQIGSLSLVLRPIADNNVELERAIARGDVQVPEGGDPAAEKRMLMEIASKPVDTTPTFTVGGEVSRFQRTSVPTSKTPNADEVVGPAVRVARGNNVTIVPLGAK